MARLMPAAAGALHWSSFLYGQKAGDNGDNAIFNSLSGWDGFACPSIETGGLPATNTFGGNRDEGQVNMELVQPDPYGRPTLTRVTTSDLAPDPAPGQSFKTHLDWVGRNHGKKELDAAGRDNRKSNFLYADGHVETKTIYETVENSQWGKTFFSLKPGNDISK